MSSAYCPHGGNISPALLNGSERTAPVDGEDEILIDDIGKGVPLPDYEKVQI